MTEYVDCRECNTECARADGNYGYTFCSCFTPKKKTVTNADRIRSMTDKEIAEWVCENGAIKTPCDIICGGDCKALATFDKSSMDVCKEIVMKWLKQPAVEEADHESV